jgi:serine/threonine-protein kinase
MVGFGREVERVALVPGSNAGPYRIVEPLGRGGMASVYRAYEPALERYVALKVLPREFLHDPGFAERFQREARVIAKLEHPNIVPIYNYDIDETEGIPWMAMRLVPGGALAQLLKGERLPFARSVAILRGVADALDHAHGKGIVHRDVKPQNVLLDEGGRVYLADFGIAKMFESSGGLTATGMITGTPQYMAPEQATGTKVGPLADVYALGVVAYEMFTGRPPFSADTPVAVLMKHVQEPLPLPPPETVPEGLLRPLLKCLAKRPEDRWATAGAFVGALEAGLEARTPALDQVPTGAIPPPFPRTVVSPPVPAPPRTGPPAPPPTKVQPPLAEPPPLAPPPRVGRRQPPVSSAPDTSARDGFGPAAIVLGGLAGALVLAGAVGVAVLVVGGGRRPLPSPLPTRADGATSLPPPAAPIESPTSSGLQPVPTPTRPVRRESPASPFAVPVSRPMTPVGSFPLPTATPRPPAPEAVTATTPTPTPTRAAEPTAPAVDPEVLRLAGALGGADPATRRRAAQDLAALGPRAAPALAALTTALGDRSVDVRLRAAEALGRLGPAARPAVPDLARALKDADPMVRAESAKSLGVLAEAATPSSSSLGETLRDSDVAVRREAAKALARFGRGAEPALRALIDALKDKDKTVRAQSARALGHIGSPAREAVPLLTALGRDPDLVVSREAQAALESIGP